jgi:hypothetical protein
MIECAEPRVGFSPEDGDVNTIIVNNGEKEL